MSGRPVFAFLVVIPAGNLLLLLSLLFWFVIPSAAERTCFLPFFVRVAQKAYRSALKSMIRADTITFVAA